MTTPAPRIDIREAPLSVDEALACVRRAGAGGLAVFVGAVRDESAGRVVTRLEYSAYASMAKREMERIAEEIEAEIPGVRVAAMHRTGSLEVGDAAVVCAASAPHRGEAFRACRELIDRIKSRVPIWKREIGPDGAAWVGWEDARCGPEHGHSHDHGHDHDH
jgi:molybdopterin synthase catalytic subunit